MRRSYVIAYDIFEPKRLRRVYLTMRGFGEALQYSVFICELSPAEKMILIGKLDEIIDHKIDRILIVDMGLSLTEGGNPIYFLGAPTSIPKREAVIV